MSGSKLGGKRAATTNKARHGEDFYVRLGQLGGKVKTTGGFANMDPEKLSAAGKKGGMTSRRGPAV